ncbi:tetratricopeptide repeat protein [Trichloromonas sp.]|uniref:tetratricopeptide repeat protein n=1 Tax=Trichloromonas sp. TaxID=3069249 RepID=UPI003D81A9B2
MTTRTFTVSWTFFLRCLLILVILPALLCSCTTSVVKRSSFDATAIDRAPATDNSANTEDQLKNLSSEELRDKGKVHLAQGNLPLAKIHFLLSVKKAPEELPAYIDLAKTMELEGHPRQAEDIYSFVLSKESNNIPALLGQGRLQRNQGATANALETFKKANLSDSSNVEVMTELAITYDILGKEPLAEMLYLTVIGLRPENAAAYNNLGFNFLLQKKYSKAISNFHIAMIKDPKNKTYQTNLATAYALIGQENKALVIFERAMDPPAAYNNLGYIYMTQGMTREAKEALQHALDLNPIYYARAQENLKQLTRSQVDTTE